MKFTDDDLRQFTPEYLLTERKDALLIAALSDINDLHDRCNRKSTSSSQPSSNVKHKGAYEQIDLVSPKTGEFEINEERKKKLQHSVPIKSICSLTNCFRAILNTTVSRG